MSLLYVPSVITGVLMAGEVRVLLVRVSVVARPTRVSVDVGSVRVPVLEMVLIMGAVSVLLVSVSAPARVATVPDVGKVRDVVADSAKVKPKAPLIAMVDKLLLDTPVPPFAGVAKLVGESIS